MGGGMMNEGTNWMPPLIVLGIGVIVGLFLALRMAKGKRAAAMHAARPTDDLELRDLRVQRDLLLAQLRDLEDTGGKRSAEDLARARYALELEAARALRDLDQAEAASRATAAKAPAPAAVQQGSSALAGALWGGGVVAFGAILFFVLQGQMSERGMGGSLTGNDISIRGPAAAAAPQAPGQAPAQPDPELEAFLARAQANPRDLEAQLDLAQAFLYRDQLIDVFQTVQTARAIDPDNPRALTYEAVVRQAMGQADQALQMLDQALAKDPAMAEAWVRRGLVAFDLSKWEVAVQSWEKALELRPDGREALQPVIAEAKLRMQGKATAMPSAPAPAPVAAAPAPAIAAPAAAGPNDLQLVLDLDPALAGKIPPGTPIFISVRPAGVKAGPPAAAKRLASSTFPITVAIGAADTMMGQPIPASAYVEARIDADGNAMTRSPSDPSASADGVTPGNETRLLLRAGD